MEFLPRLFTSGRIDQPAAVHRANLFPLSGLPQVARQTRSDQLQCGSLVCYRLESAISGVVHPTGLLVSEQQWIHSPVERRQLFMGDAHNYRLWHRIPDEFLRRGFRASHRRDNRSDVQGLQRLSRFLGLKPHHGAAVRTDMAADVLGNQLSLQLWPPIALPATRDLERLRRRNRDRNWH